MGLGSVGFGLSGSGAFSIDDFEVWAGTDFATTDVEMKGDAYITTTISDDGILPEAVAKYIEAAPNPHGMHA